MEQLKQQIKQIYELKEREKAIQKQIDELNAELKPIEASIDTLSKILLEDMSKANVKEVYDTEDSIVAGVFSKQSTGYKDETEVINILESMNLNSLISLKKSLSKRLLSKELKSNKQLSEALKDYTVDRTTDYVVVTDVDNYKTMLEHIKAAK